MSEAPAAPRTVSADPATENGLNLLLTPPQPRSGWRLVPARVIAMCAVELQKLRHDRTELYTRAVQPALWLLIFGQTFTRIKAIPTGGIPYIDYLAPGIIAQSAMFIAIFYGIQIIWERDAGILNKLLVTPTPRSALITGKAFAAGVKSLIQAVVVVLIAALLGVALTWNPLKLIGVGGDRDPRLGLLLLSVDDHRRHRAQQGPADGFRTGDHHAAVLRVQRPLPGGDHAGLVAGGQQGEPAELRSGRCAGCCSAPRPMWVPTSPCCWWPPHSVSRPPPPCSDGSPADLALRRDVRHARPRDQDSTAGQRISPAHGLISDQADENAGHSAFRSFDSALSTQIGSSSLRSRGCTVYEPNVVGDWQEYDEHAGLRVRVHSLAAAEPPRGRDDAAEGLTYFTLRVTVENRGARHYGIHLEDGQIDVRVGPDGESAFIDWRSSQFIEGFDVYPLRRATAVVYAAGAEDSLKQVDVQVQLRVEEEWTERRLWAGGIGLCEAAVAAGVGRDGLAHQVSNFLRDQAEPGTP